MGLGRASLSTLLAVSLAACGGGGGSGGGNPISGGGGSSGGGSSTCSLSARQDFVKAVIDEWYLFPTLVNNSVNKASHSDVQSYIDALVAPARAESKDRYFTYITSIAEENAFFNSGSSAGFGVRLGYDTVNNRVFVIEVFETGPAFAQGFDRGTELISIGTSASTLQSVSSLMANGGPQAVIDALGPSDAGLSRTFVIRPVGGANTQVTVSKADYSLDPVSDRYGAKIIDDGGKKVGYINLRTFIDSADADLRTAFDTFRQQGVTEVIVDLRYNGGGLVRIAELFGDLLGRNYSGQVFSRTTLRSSKSSENSTRNFTTQSQAITATKIAFIGRGGTASASELVTNSMIPYLGNNMALVGTNTYGKPVGQYGFDKAECDDRLRVVTFKTENRDGQGEYFTGLASVVPNTCAANDDIFTQLGDPNEASVAQALSFLRNGAASCTAISGGGQGTASARSAASPERELLQPRYPTPAQHEVPGLF
ncbi:MAG: peptidase S41 [Sphingomonadaceae bacterium]|nr:peptidase S41 [Sphingomonadaceae bacterium]MCP5383183.1 peptidase S41 [Altererythrobacter sp.]MCP5390465.1 peptidase S41 [Sphingomonadaceae bacterium]MCP5393360.1 peptidase S41 [Sphingomonadaceae bacterium]